MDGVQRLLWTSLAVALAIMHCLVNEIMYTTIVCSQRGEGGRRREGVDLAGTSIQLRTSVN